MIMAPKDTPKPDSHKAEAHPDKKPKGAGWLARFAPGVRKLVEKREQTPENLWVKCPDTGEMIYRADLDAAAWVTPSGFHMR
ncbi:MAG: acetyl-CoA carboxylase carboxyl transferase subunit beta, partial [Caulobacteraceae bacterium]